MLTQLARVSEARELRLDRVTMRVTPRFTTSGSIKADTIASRLVDVQTRLEITSPATNDELVALIATAERMCYMLDVIRTPHEVHGTVVLNGEEQV